MLNKLLLIKTLTIILFSSLFSVRSFSAESGSVALEQVRKSLWYLGVQDNTALPVESNQIVADTEFPEELETALQKL